MAATDDDAPVDGERDKRITRAIKFMRRVSENDSTNRQLANYWRKFRYGEQWPPEIQNSRTLEQRPCITVNKTDTFCRQVENQQRQQRPRIKVDPTNGQATKKVADVIKGMIRHIESAKGGADVSYDTGFAHAITEGRGYWRVMADYVREDSFEQELYLMPVEDPLSVYYDDNIMMPDGSDCEECLIVEDISKDAFKALYPDKDWGEGFTGTDQDADWVTPDKMRVAEYYYVERHNDTLVKLNTGEIGWKSALKPKIAVTIVRERPGVRREVKWCKLTACDVLEERDWPGKYIPVIPCSGEKWVIDGKRRRSGLVKNAVGPAQMSNYWKTAMTETVALAAKAKWLIAEGQDEGHEQEWATANVSARPTLRYKPTDIGGKAVERPERIQPEPPPSGAMAMAAAVDADLSAVLGIVDPAMRIGGNVSGKALQAERMQSDNSTFNYFDDMTRAIAYTGRILLDLLRYFYAEPGRVARIIGDDGKSRTEALNQPNPADPSKIINDITVGEYAVVMDAGPGYNTRRQEAREAMTPLFESDPELMKVAGDIYFRSMDYTGADQIADRLAASNPLSQIDESSEVPPQAQMKIKQQDVTIKQMQQAIQQLQMEAKFRIEPARIKDEGDTKRALIHAHADLEVEKNENAAWMRDVDEREATRRHDTEVRSLTAISVAEINQAGKIITQDKDHKHDAAQFEKVAAHEDDQLARKSAEDK